MYIEEIIKNVLNQEDTAFFYTPPIYKNAYSYFFENPAYKLKSNNTEDFQANLNKMNNLIEKDLIGCGFISYEAGYMLEEKLNKYVNDSSEIQNLLFNFYSRDKVKKIKSQHLNFSNAGKIITGQNFSISNYRLNTTSDEYIKNIGVIKNYIREGDTYQVNYTVKGKFNFSGSIESLFLQLLFNQSAKYSALINTGSKIIISISPELFFSNNNGTLTALPMKGTAPRGINSFEDELIREDLFTSSKNKAENVMIVDLLRNDLGKISKTNSVKVPSLYNIEQYESVFQMTSEINSTLADYNFSDVINNIFPCGSITGAPKLRTMEIINEIEKEARGVYTGAIGMVEKDNWIFNVGIRTIVIDKNTGNGELGIGSGIVWDSEADEEYNEVLLKSNFLTKPKKYFELFETMLYDQNELFLFDLHLKRLKEAAKFFLFKYDEKKIKEKIENEILKLNSDKKYKIKLMLGKWGDISIDKSELTLSNKPFKIVISKNKIDSENCFQYFKTTNRNLYNSELVFYTKQGFDEVIFLNEKNEITEGSFTNIFIKLDGKWYTPPIKSGLLNGVYRNYLLQNNIQIKDRKITIKDLHNSEKIILTNSVRKIINIESIQISEKNIKKFKISPNSKDII